MIHSNITPKIKSSSVRRSLHPLDEQRPLTLSHLNMIATHVTTKSTSPTN